LGEQLADLTKKVLSMEKANMAAPAKSPVTQEEITAGAPDNSAPEKKGNFEADGVTPKLKEATPAHPTLKTQEEGNVAPVKKAEDAVPATEEVELDEFGKPKKKKIEEAEIKDAAPVEKAKNPATSSIETQEAPAVPAVEKAANPATSSLKTQETPAVPAPAKTVKKSLEQPADETKIAEATNKLLLAELQTLRKRLDALDVTPKPRKFKVEKNFGNSEHTEVTEGLEVAMQKCVELRKQESQGKKLTVEENAYIQKTLDTSLEAKFGKNL
ncbi:MAG: hypothetical protein ABL876_19205, partial [Chitinophagaceae bacterium]